MNLNVHPIFVHFPIALLMLYSLVELIPLNRVLPWWKINWLPIKRFLLYVGTLAAIPTILSGLLAKTIVGESALIDLHETVALTTITIFTILSILNLLLQLKRIKPSSGKTVLIKVLTVAGILGLVLVGSLGASIIYGTQFDPIASFVTHLLGIK